MAVSIRSLPTTRSLKSAPRIQIRQFHQTPLQSSSPLFHLAALSASREGQFISKASGISRVDYSPNSQLLRAEASGSTIPEEPSKMESFRRESRSPIQILDEIFPPKPRQNIEAYDPIVEKRIDVGRNTKQIQDQPARLGAKRSIPLGQVHKPVLDRKSWSAEHQENAERDPGTSDVQGPRPILLEPLLMDTHEKKYLMTVLRASLSADQMRQVRDESDGSRDEKLHNVELQAMGNGYQLVNDREGLIRYLKEGIETEQWKFGCLTGIFFGLAVSSLVWLSWNHLNSANTSPRHATENVPSVDASKRLTTSEKIRGVRQDLPTNSRSESSGGLTSWFWSAEK
ncbi:MAG: hypothetical protein M1822_003458 [Bathelium mastoideum]|nr:MAG: hypothetical protein M1822_003458 [Bathelium mastoideum]